jgi:ADP-heptose:LPS heptosyltransferase
MQPVLKYIKEKYPKSKIVYSASKEIKDLIGCYPKGLVDEILNGNLFVDYETFLEFDYHIYPNFAITKNISAKTENAYDIFKEYAGLDFNVKDYMPKLNPKKFILDEFRGKLPEKYVVIQLRASTGNRMIRSEKWREVIPQIIELGYDVVFLDNPGFYNLYETEIVNYFPHLKENIWNLCKATKNLKYSISIISQAKAVIAIDSALAHVAGAMNIPLLGIYGPFDPDTRLKYYDKYEVVTPKNVNCELFPCHFHQDELHMGQCDYVKFQAFPDCMEKIDENEIVEKFKKLME